MSGWGSGSWGSSPWGIGSEDEAIGDLDAGISEVNLYAIDTIEVIFDTLVRNDATLNAIEAWRIDLAGGAGNQVTIKAVKTSGDVVVDRVYLTITPYSLGAFYCLVATAPVRSSKGELLVGTDRKIFKGRFTKVDSLCRNRPAMYDLRPTSLYRNLLNAIGRQDDIIGGTQDEGTEKVPPCPEDE